MIPRFAATFISHDLAGKVTRYPTAAEMIALTEQQPMCKNKACEKLETELRYWKGVVRGARAELHEAGRITNDEYAQLCEDREVRNYVDRVDVLRAGLDRISQLVSVPPFIKDIAETALKDITPNA